MARCPMCRSPHTRLGRARPLSALAAAARKLASAVRRAPRRLLYQRPAPGEWAINEVLCHLADAEFALGFRIRKIASEPGSTIAAWDQERFADGGHYRRVVAAEALGTFVALRRSNLAYLRRLRPGQRQQSGRHPEYGRLSIAQILDHWAEHDLNHIEQIGNALRALARRT